ncbi:FIGN protein, partial [Amia calva]|nr:FIGN protein [Amia calva]
MHWTPEHAQPLTQWPEQHLDVSSTTSSPAHKSDLYPSSRQRYNYAWANDDISALTASNLLKRYAEKYSSVLDSPYDRAPGSGIYSEGAFGSLNGQKSETEPWSMSHGPEGGYSLGPPPPPGHEVLGGSKGTATSGGPPGPGSVSIVNSNLSDPGYSGAGSCSGPPTQEYPPTYNGTYLSSGYCTQPGPPGLLQTTTSLVPSYTPPGSVYNYPPSSYPPQPGYATVHPPTPYLPSGLAAPTPLPPRPTVMGGSYGYQGHGGLEPNSLKRKAFEMGGVEEEEGEEARYRKYGYDPTKPGSSPYSADKECRGNGFAGTDPPGAGYKPGKPPAQPGLGGDEGDKYGGLKPLVSPPYSGGGEAGLRAEYSPPVGLAGENGGGEHGFAPSRVAVKLPAPPVQSEELLKTAEPRLLELVSGEVLQRVPALGWGELVCHGALKAALEEELLWPALRPSPTSRPPRTLLFFGPRGGGKPTLARCLAAQLGAAFFRLSGAVLASQWKGDAEQILRTTFLLAGARQPSLVFVDELEALSPEDGLWAQLLSCLDTAQQGGAGAVLVVGATRRPDALEEAAHRRFSKRYYVGLPDAAGRRQILLQALGQQGACLSERELGCLLQRSEGFSTHEVLQLCQQAAASASASAPPTPLHSLPALPLSFKDFENAFCKVRPHATPKELDTCMEWSKVYSH